MCQGNTKQNHTVLSFHNKYDLIKNLLKDSVSISYENFNDKLCIRTIKY
jgi:hypothetical protein